MAFFNKNKTVKTSTYTKGTDKKGNQFRKKVETLDSPKKSLTTDQAKLKSQEMSGKTLRATTYAGTVGSSISNITNAVSDNAKAKIELAKYLNDTVNDMQSGDPERDEETGGEKDYNGLLGIE